MDKLRDLAKKIGAHCEQAVTLTDKIFLPYHSRKLRDDWIYRQLVELVNVAPAAELRCPHCNVLARRVEWCDAYRMPHICPSDHISHSRPDLFCGKCGDLILDDSNEKLECTHRKTSRGIGV